MPQTSNSNTPSTVETILDAAAKVFAEKGFDGARVDELARASGVNKATLYYQIGDKEALYHAVLEQVFRRTADEAETALKGIDDPEEQIRRFINVFAKATSNMRYASPILLREIASGGRNLPDLALAQMGRILRALTRAIADGEKQGLFRQVNGFMVHMMIVGSLSFYASNEPIRQRFTRQHPDISVSGHFVSNLEAGQQIADLILASIRHPAVQNKKEQA